MIARLTEPARSGTCFENPAAAVLLRWPSHLHGIPRRKGRAASLRDSVAGLRCTGGLRTTTRGSIESKPALSRRRHLRTQTARLLGASAVGLHLTTLTIVAINRSSGIEKCRGPYSCNYGAAVVEPHKKATPTVCVGRLGLARCRHGGDQDIVANQSGLHTDIEGDLVSAETR